MCIKQRRQAGHRLLQAEFLVEGREFVERLPLTGFCLAPAIKDVPGADTTG